MITNSEDCPGRASRGAGGSGKTARRALVVGVLACRSAGCGDPPVDSATSTGAGAGEGTASTTSGGSGTSGPRGGGGGGGGGMPVFDCSPPVGALPSLALELVAEGFDSPVGLEVAPGDAGHLYIVEQGGRVQVIEDGVVRPTPFLDYSGIVWKEAEAGLLGLAFHPAYAENGRLFIYYIEQSSPGGSHLVELGRSDSDPMTAEPEMVGGSPLLTVPHTTIHLGGALNFGPLDSNLYLALGDRGYGPWAQDLQNLMGKIIRIDVSTTPYSIPVGNMMGGAPEIWAYGLRNPWRTSFDPCTGDHFIADVGEEQREELDIETSESGARNYGWPMMEGTECNPASSTCDPTASTLPAVDYPHYPDPAGFNVIVGGAVYRGSRIPGLRGAYLHSSTTGRLFAIRHQQGVVTEASELPLSYGGAPFSGVIVSVDQDHEGEVYLVELDPGRVFRLIPSP